MILGKRRLAALLAATAAAILFASLSYGRTPDVPSKGNILFICIDTLRADRLACYGYRGMETPNIDSLAGRGVLFRQTLCQVPITLPSHSSIFTGLNPTVHDVKENGTFRLDPMEFTLAEILKDHGYRTAAFIGGFPLDAKFGTDQGFDVYDDNMSTPSALLAGKRRNVWQGHKIEAFERRAVDVVNAARHWLALNNDKMFFLFLHLFDPHLPYSPPEPFLSTYRKRPYDGEVAYADHCLGPLLQDVKRLGLTEKTLVILTSDHGESLGEHRYFGHGENLYEPSVHIPLIMARPSVLPQDRAIETPARSIDLLPTILELNGIKIPADVDGRSLGAFLFSEQSPAQQVVSYSETFFPMMRYKRAEIRSVKSGSWKYLRYTKGTKTVREELFDLVNDPREQHDLARQNRAKVRELGMVLDDILKSDHSRALQRRTPLQADDETKEKLRSLGYIK
ncbi:MAG: sulfatase [Candidatus Aminicenantes bacterium]|nr:sulfatase [Candidatus Aminicenantes bacterium]